MSIRISDEARRLAGAIRDSSSIDLEIVLTEILEDIRLDLNTLRNAIVKKEKNDAEKSDPT